VENPNSATNQLKVITRKRKALERLLLLARSMSKLAGSIQSLTELTDENDKLSAPAQQFYDQLSERLNKLPHDSVIGQMQDLDTKLQADMNNIILLAGADESNIDVRIRELNPAAEASMLETLDEFTNEFSRRAKLAIALRIFLRNQRIPTPGIEFRFSEKQLENELIKVKKREAHCRGVVRERVIDLIEDTEKIVNNASYPEAIREEVRTVRSELMDCLQHLDEGKDIVQLPMVVDELIITDTPAEERKVRKLALDELEAEVEDDPPDRDTEETDSDNTREQHVAQPSKHTQPGSASEPSFLDTFSVWLKTPRVVDWAKARQIAKNDLAKSRRKP